MHISGVSAQGDCNMASPSPAILKQKRAFVDAFGALSTRDIEQTGGSLFTKFPRKDQRPILCIGNGPVSAETRAKGYDFIRTQEPLIMACNDYKKQSAFKQAKAHILGVTGLTPTRCRSAADIVLVLDQKDLKAYESFVV